MLGAIIRVAHHEVATGVPQGSVLSPILQQVHTSKNWKGLKTEFFGKSSTRLSTCETRP